jgi:signal transduction histidine kinase
MGTETRNVDQPTVLLISDDPEFARAVMGRWQAERSVPAFTLMSGDVCRGTDPETFDAAVVGTVRPGILPAILATLEVSGKPVLLVCKESQSAQEVRAGQANKLLEREATLGRYMLEMRHTLNNALTSVLGNSELLLLEPGCLSAVARSQIETVRNMAVRMHEILQRFSSIENELSVVEKAERESRSKSQAAAASS